MGERCNTLALVHDALRVQAERAEADPSFQMKRYDVIVEQCRTSAERYDFSSWSDADLKHFFLHHFSLSMQWDGLATLLFDGFQSRHDDDEDEDEGDDGDEEAGGDEGAEEDDAEREEDDASAEDGGGGGGGGEGWGGGQASADSAGGRRRARWTRGKALQDEIRRARAVYSAAVTEEAPEPQTPAPPEETELAILLERASTRTTTTTEAISRHVGDAEEADPHPSAAATAARQEYGPNGEPLLLLASGVAVSTFGCPRRAGGDVEASPSPSPSPTHTFNEMSEDGVVGGSPDRDGDHRGEDVERDDTEVAAVDEAGTAAPPPRDAAEKSSSSSGRTEWRRVSGVVSRVEIARNGQFTCPVGCGAVFMSPGPSEASLGLLPDARSSSSASTSASASGAHDGGGGGDGRHSRTGRGGRGGVGSALSSDPTAAAVGAWLTSTLRHPSCAALDGVETLEALEEAAEAGRVPPILCVHRLRGGVVAEFVPRPPSPPSSSSSSNRSDGGVWGGEGLSPVAWFRFTPRGELPQDVRCDPYADLLSVELERLRWGRVACVKLIACENLMDEWEDHHDAPNVDCRKFILHGVPVTLGDYLREEAPYECA